MIDFSREIRTDMTSWSIVQRQLCRDCARFCFSFAQKDTVTVAIPSCNMRQSIWDEAWGTDAVYSGTLGYGGAISKLSPWSIKIYESRPVDFRKPWSPDHFQPAIRRWYSCLFFGCWPTKYINFVIPTGTTPRILLAESIMFRGP